MIILIFVKEYFSRIITHLVFRSINYCEIKNEKSRKLHIPAFFMLKFSIEDLGNGMFKVMLTSNLDR